MVDSAGLWLKADASRRRNGPRNPPKAAGSMVRSRSKSVRGNPRGVREGANALSNLPDGECGGKDQVSRKITYHFFGGFHTMYEDKVLVCKDCGNEFVWTAGEQAFYAERGLQNAPARCRDCRQARKAARSDAGAPREMHDIICSNCGKPDQVSFVPSGDRPVLCRECFAAMRAQRG